jgi:hypothetical protein
MGTPEEYAALDVHIGLKRERVKNPHVELNLEQRKIDIEQTAFMILGTLVRYQRGDDGLSWNAKMIAAPFPKLSFDAICLGLNWLLKNKCVEHKRCRWTLTWEGRELYAAEASAPHFQTGKSDREFRTESLTGMDEHGNETRLTTAVLPCPSISGHGNNAERRLIAIHDTRARLQTLASENGLTIDETAEGLQDESIHLCNKCGRLRKHHRSNTGGHSFQTPCVICKKGKR